MPSILARRQNAATEERASNSVSGHNPRVEFPVGFALGRLWVPAHLVLEALAYVIGFRLYVSLRRRWGDVIPTTVRWSAIAGAAVGAALGSKILAWLQHPAETMAHLGDLAYMMGGKTIVGGLLGGILGVEVAKKISGETRSTGDLFVLPLCLAIAIGRVGCFLSGTTDGTHGIETSLPFGVDFGDGVHRHPAQLYEIVALGLIAWWAIAKRGTLARSGDLFRGFMLLYLGFRLAIDFIKPDPRAYLGLTAIQVACVLGLLYYARDARRVFATPKALTHG
jgi:prolipoprotein diacylglyceryltransferase